MNILIAAGSFKDVYSPIESCKIIKESLPENCGSIDVIPMCDGGEYTYDILECIEGYKKEIAFNIRNAYGKLIDVNYLVKDKEAHIVSSEVIRLYPNEDMHKNPLVLSDYGVGQVVLDAINKGYSSINLYIGGTSTVSGGIGLAQALGATIIDKNGTQYDNVILAKDLKNIASIKFDKGIYSNIEFNIIADGDAKSYDIPSISRLKIGKKYIDKSEEIISELYSGVENVRTILNISKDEPFSGAAGGMIYGIYAMFNAKAVLGVDYINEMLDLENNIVKADYVITGEGRLDNTACGKTPASVARLAKLHEKKVIYVCGQLDDSFECDYSSGIIDGESDTMLDQMGIWKLVTCKQSYEEHPAEGKNYEEAVIEYKNRTPMILKELFKRVFA